MILAHSKFLILRFPPNDLARARKTEDEACQFRASVV